MPKRKSCDQLANNAATAHVTHSSATLSVANKSIDTTNSTMEEDLQGLYDNELHLDEPLCLIDNVFRHILPYYYTFETFVKLRWQGRTIGDVFTKEFVTTPETVERSCANGGISVNGVSVASTHVLKAGEKMAHRVHRHEPPVLRDAHRMRIIFSNAAFVVVDKPCSMPVHPSGAYRHNSVIFALARQLADSNDIDCSSSSSSSSSSISNARSKTILLRNNVNISTAATAAAEAAGTQEPWQVQRLCASASTRGAKLYNCYRLDRLTSGVLILARTSAAAARVTAAMSAARQSSASQAEGAAAAESHGRVRKHYLALVSGRFDALALAARKASGESASADVAHDCGTLCAHTAAATATDDDLCGDGVVWLRVNQAITLNKPRQGPNTIASNATAEAQRGARSTPGDDSNRAKLAVTWFARVAYDATADVSLVYCVPITGRNHQLRVHLAHLQAPICGDPLYASGAGGERAAAGAPQLRTEQRGGLEYGRGVCADFDAHCETCKFPYVNDANTMKMRLHAFAYTVPCDVLQNQNEDVLNLQDNGCGGGARTGRIIHDTQSAEVTFQSDLPQWASESTTLARVESVGKSHAQAVQKHTQEETSAKNDTAKR